MKKTSSPPSRSRVPEWMDPRSPSCSIIPIGGVPSGVHEIRDDRGDLVAIIAPHFVWSETKGSGVPAGIDAVHVVAMSSVDYVNALLRHLQAEPGDNDALHVNMLLRALASLEGALFYMDRSAFAAVADAPRGTNGARALSAHHAVFDVLGLCVSWVLRELKPLQRERETPLEFFERIAPTLLRVPDRAATRLRETAARPDPCTLFEDWSNAGVLLRKEVAQVRAASAAPDPVALPVRMTLNERILLACIDGDAKRYAKCTQIQKAIGDDGKDGAGVRRAVGKLVASGHLIETATGFKTTPEGLALLPQSVSKRHTR